MTSKSVLRRIAVQSQAPPQAEQFVAAEVLRPGRPRWKAVSTTSEQACDHLHLTLSAAADCAVRLSHPSAKLTGRVGFRRTRR